MLTVCCVNFADYLGRGDDYVNNLFLSVSENLTLPHRFACFCDAIADYLHTDIRVHPLPDGLTGYYNKLALFRSGVFAEGSRVLLLDLDTVICGSLDEIASYDGEFAMLGDLWYPHLKASGVMAWRAGFGAHIWDSYVAAGMPTDVKHDGANFGGDGAWISQQVPRAQALQDLYPGQILSYKDKALPGVLTPQARICAFHGSPRPHEVTEGWVPHFWKGEQ